MLVYHSNSSHQNLMHSHWHNVICCHQLPQISAIGTCRNNLWQYARWITCSWLLKLYITFSVPRTMFISVVTIKTSQPDRMTNAPKLCCARLHVMLKHFCLFCHNCNVCCLIAFELSVSCRVMPAWDIWELHFNCDATTVVMLMMTTLHANWCALLGCRLAPAWDIWGNHSSRRPAATLSYLSWWSWLH